MQLVQWDTLGIEQHLGHDSSCPGPLEVVEQCSEASTEAGQSQKTFPKADHSPGTTIVGSLLASQL